MDTVTDHWPSNSWTAAHRRDSDIETSPYNSHESTIEKPITLPASSSDNFSEI